MARFIDISYNLNSSFEDGKGNTYSSLNAGGAAAKALALWARMAKEAPKDLGPNGISLSYSGDTSIGLVSFEGGNTYPAMACDVDSFDGIAKATSEYLSFSSVGSGESPTATSDQPFSISFWMKWDGTDSTSALVAKNAGPGLAIDEYMIKIFGNDAKIWFRISDADTTDAWARLQTPNGIIQPGKWYHIVCSYNGDGATAATAPASCMKIYINGVDTLSFAASNGGNTYVGMAPVWTGPLYIGASSTGIDIFDGEISEFAAWKNYELSAEEVAAIYNGTRSTCRERVSGFLNNPPRTVLRSFDEMTGSYPTILRTTGRASTSGKGANFDPFDDTRTIVYGPSQKIQYPFVLTTSDTNRYKSSWIATPNTVVTGVLSQSCIIAPATASSGISDQGIIPSVNQDLLIEPFDDSRIHIGDSPFYNTGTPETIFPGFSSRLADKIQINIPLDSQVVAYASRWNYLGMQGDNAYGGVDTYAAPSGEFATTSFTGFLYYNHTSKKWQDVGEIDPATKATIDTRMWYHEYRGGNQYAQVGRWESPGRVASVPTGRQEMGWNRYFKRYQFSMSHHMGFIARSTGDLMAMGYDKIGSPTISGEAPYEPVYHATEGQTLSLSDYISHPFLLEKAVIDIPVLVRMKNGNRYLHLGEHPYASPTDTEVINTALVNGALRDIDNYTFFMYRQSRIGGVTRDSAQDVSGSVRYLIASGCAAFYNSNAWNYSIRLDLEESGSNLPHAPSFSHDFNLGVSGSYGGSAELSIAGFPLDNEIISIEFQPITFKITNQIGLGSATGWSLVGSEATAIIDSSQGDGTLYGNVGSKVGGLYDLMGSVLKGSNPGNANVDSASGQANGVSRVKAVMSNFPSDHTTAETTVTLISNTWTGTSVEITSPTSSPPIQGQVINAGAEASFTGSIRIEMVPAVGNRQFNAGSRFPMRWPSGSIGGANNSPGDGQYPRYGSITVTDFWPGGTTFRGPNLMWSGSHAKTSYPPAQSGPTSGRLVGRSAGPNTLFPSYNSPSWSTSRNLSYQILKRGWFNSYPNLGTYIPGPQYTWNPPSSAPAGTYNIGIPTASYAVNRGVGTGSISGMGNPDGASYGNTGLEPRINLSHYLRGERAVDPRPLVNPLGLESIAEAAITIYATSSSPSSGWFGAPTSTPFDGIRRAGTGSWQQTAPLTKGDLPSSTPSPYLLFPEDEIVIGLDAGISIPPVSGTSLDWTSTIDADYGVVKPLYGAVRAVEMSAMSGSFMKLLQGPASITLFGSMVRENEEKLFELNQPLTSDAIHEALHFDNPVVDQYQIATREELSGSYTSRIVLGSISQMLDPYEKWHRTVLGGILSFMSTAKRKNVDLSTWQITQLLWGPYVGTPGIPSMPMSMLRRGAYGDFASRRMIPSASIENNWRTSSPGHSGGRAYPSSSAYWKSVLCNVKGNTLAQSNLGALTGPRNSITAFYLQNIPFNYSTRNDTSAGVKGGYGGPSFGFGPQLWSGIQAPISYTEPSNLTHFDGRGDGTVIKSDPEGVRWWNVRISRTCKSSKLMGMVKLIDKTERFYDTLMPDIADYIIRAGCNTWGYNGYIDASKGELNDINGDPWGLHIKNITGSGEPATVRARINGWTGGQLQEQASLGLNMYYPHIGTSTTHGTDNPPQQGCANRYAYPYDTPVKRKVNEYFRIEVKPAATQMYMPGPVYQNNPLPFEICSQGFYNPILGGDPRSFDDCDDWVLGVTGSMDGYILRRAYWNTDVDAGSSSTPAMFNPQHQKWAEILNSRRDPIAARNVLFKKGYDMTLRTGVDGVSGSFNGHRNVQVEPLITLRYHNYTGRPANPGLITQRAASVGVASPGAGMERLPQRARNIFGAPNECDCEARYDASMTSRAWNDRSTHHLAVCGAPVYRGSPAYGFAYGILNTRPQKTAAIFRSDRFGQFRDMLEQRQDAKIFKVRGGRISRAPGNKLYQPGGLRSVGALGERDGPVQCVFVDEDDGQTIVSPYATDSFNMSNECTSSIPFRDGVPTIVTGSYITTSVTYLLSSDISPTDMTRDYTF